MFNNKIIVMLILILIITIIVISFIILFNIINSKKIEKFETSTSSAITYRILMSDVKTVTTKTIDISNQKMYKYYSIFEQIETNDNNNYFFNIYYSYKITFTPDRSISYLFTNSDLNKIGITLTKPENRPIAIETNSTNNDGTPRILLNKIINDNYIVVDFINQYGSDTAHRIYSVKIAVDNKSITDVSYISFYYSDNTAKTTDPYQMNLIDLSYYNFKIETNNNINIYTYYFSNSNIDPLAIDDITINFKTSNNVILYYINIYGLPNVEYYNIINTIHNTSELNNQIFEGGDITSANLVNNQDYGNNDIMNNSYKNKEFDSLSLSDTFKKIIENNIPWGIYDGAQISKKVDINNKINISLVDLLERKCRDAIIIDTANENNTINSKEESYYVGYDTNNNLLPNPVKTNISYLKASSSLIINFPLGSLPYKYTICAITRYVGNGMRNRILTSKNLDPINFLLGHWGGSTYKSFNNAWNSDENKTNDTNWIVSCVKSTGNQNTRQTDFKYNTLLFNGKAYGNNNFVGYGYSSSQLKDTNNILSINGLSSETSDFGLSYLIIWDQILTDSELDLVSKSLINTLIDNSYKLPLSQIQISNKNDGLTKDTSVNNAKNIIDNTCNYIDNYYWINILNDKKKIFCVLNNNVGNFGGGWMMAMKGAKNSQTFMYYSDYWTTNNTLNQYTYIPNIFNDINNEIKTEIFNQYKFSEILIIYNDPQFNNNPYYKTSYYKLNNIEIRGKYSLREFFANNLNDFNYNNKNSSMILDLNNSIINFNPISTSGCINYNIVTYDKFLKNYLANPSGFNYTTDVFSQQHVCCAYGINLNFNPPHWHKVRIGAIFNENEGSWFQSIDVCGGIGLRFGYASGDYISCCQSSTGLNRSLPFLLFVR